VGDVDWGRVAVLVAVVVPSVIFHEVAHGWVANLFGDDTAKRAGRLSLNPLKHVDPFGTLILPFALSLTGVGAFGYAKPVPVNPRRLRHPRQHSLYVSLAGPATNLALALFAGLALRFAYADSVPRSFDLPFLDLMPLVPQLLFWLGFMNVLLAVFNLLPIPPLDGSALVERVLPTSWWPTWLKFRQWGFGIILLLVFVAPQALDRVLEPALEQWVKLL
jgi:Zn-dependent protease